MEWTVDKLMIQIADILVRLENDKADDAMELAAQVVGDTDYHAKAHAEYQSEDELVQDFLMRKAMEEDPLNTLFTSEQINQELDSN